MDVGVEGQGVGQLADGRRWVWVVGSLVHVELNLWACGGGYLGSLRFGRAGGNVL